MKKSINYNIPVILNSCLMLLLILSGANGQGADHFRFIDNGKVRLGIDMYTPGTTRLTSYRYKSNGKGGAESDACSYFAPVGHFRITPGFIYEYDVYLTIGEINEIRDLFYRMHSKLL